MNINKKRAVYTIAATLLVVFTTTYAVLMTLERTDYRNFLQAEYTKSLYQLVDSMTNVRSDLAKAAITGSKNQGTIIFEDIFRNASMANDKLSSLPVAPEIAADTNKFLSQVGDFSSSLVKASAQGVNLTSTDYASIDRLKDQALILEQELNRVISNINNGSINWGEIRQKSSGVLAATGKNLVSDKFTSIQKQVVQYPSLIYDGPFSDNTVAITPKVNSLPGVTQAQASEIAKNIMGRDRVVKLDYNPEKGKPTIEGYSFNAAIKGRSGNDPKIAITISQKGGKVIYLLDNRRIGAAKLDLRTASNVGLKYLTDIGYKNMVSTYMIRYDNTAVISYVYKQGDVIIYPDQIKLNVAMDDGSITGIESQKYLTTHIDTRNIPVPKISEAQARGKISTRLAVTSVRLAIIPTETNTELLCYEFSGTYRNENYKVYINAENGFEQRIIQIIDTPNGQLTM